MKITALTTFLDGRDRFEEGKSYDVDDAAGAYFARNGWARADGVDAAEQPQDVTLDIQSGKHGQKATTKGAGRG